MGDSLATEALPDEPRRLVLRLDRIKIEGDYPVLFTPASAPKPCVFYALCEVPFASAKERTFHPLVALILTFAGFKVYTLATNIGPLHPFSCVIGPNGIGKSVLVRKLFCFSFFFFLAYFLFLLLLIVFSSFNAGRSYCICSGR